MKLLLLAALAALPLPQPAQAAGYTPIKSLQLDCQAEITIEHVSEESFSAAEPPYYRFPGYPASAHFKAHVKVHNLTAGCAPLKTKYGLNVDGFAFAAKFSIKNPKSLEEAKQVAEGSVGETYPVQLKQYFGYEKGDYLPLFPEVHSEELYFLTSDPALPVSGSVKLEPHLNWVYGIKPLEKFTDIEKLALAEKVSALLIQGNFANFKALFLQLKPYAPAMKKAYGQLILKIFHELQGTHHSQTLEFNVGGDGSQNGAPLAKAFNKLTQEGIFSDWEIEDAAFDTPTLLLAGNPDAQGNTCLNVKEAGLLALLNELAAKLPILTPKEKYLWKSPVSTLAGKVLYGFCQERETSAAVKELASDLLPQL
jgi:hypothetical protein